MDAIGVVGTVVGVGIAAVALWFQIRGHRGTGSPGGSASSKDAVIVTVANAFPTFDTGEIGDWFITVAAYNDGPRPVTIGAWGFELPDGGSIHQVRPIEWSARAPYRLEPGDKVEFYMPLDGIRESLREQKVRLDQTKSWVRLASDRKFYGPAVPVEDD